MAGMFIEGRKIKNFADIQRNFMYEIIFDKGHSLIDGASDEDLTLRARSFSIPERGNEPIESNFGAMKQFFPGKPTFGNTMQIVFEETEKQFIQNFLFAWQQKIFNIHEGHSDHSRKRGDNGGLVGPGATDGICDLITIKAYRYNGEELENKYFLVNSWLQNVDSVSIDYSNNEAIRFTATFQFDYWTYGKEYVATTASFGLNSNIKE